MDTAQNILGFTRIKFNKINKPRGDKTHTCQHTLKIAEQNIWYFIQNLSQEKYREQFSWQDPRKLLSIFLHTLYFLVKKMIGFDSNVPNCI